MEIRCYVKDSLQGKAMKKISRGLIIQAGSEAFFQWIPQLRPNPLKSDRCPILYAVHLIMRSHNAPPSAANLHAETQR